MKLIIKRDQKKDKGFFGGDKGMKFILSYRVELTPDEQELIAKYKAKHHTLTYTTSSEGVRRIKDSVSSLMEGVTEEMDDITILLNNEDVIKKACADFKILLTVMATFGGEEVIEF